MASLLAERESRDREVEAFIQNSAELARVAQSEQHKARLSKGRALRQQPVYVARRLHPQHRNFGFGDTTFGLRLLDIAALGAPTAKRDGAADHDADIIALPIMAQPRAQDAIEQLGL